MPRPDRAPPPLLRIPPFPGGKLKFFLPAAASSAPPDPAELARCINLLRCHSVGGTFWAAQPPLPTRYVLLRTPAALRHAPALKDRFGEPVFWLTTGGVSAMPVIRGDCDPWHMLSGARAVVSEREDEVATIAALLGIQAFTIDPETGELTDNDRAPAAELPVSSTFADPFGGEPLTFAKTVELCGFWRRLIDSNRDLAGGLGFAFWKQKTVAPLLWGGSEPLRFLGDIPQSLSGASLAVWRSKSSPEAIAQAHQRGFALVEVEDGFLRSAGLGADCVPPLSITVDRLGAHFDPSGSSELEHLLQDSAFDEAVLTRARRLRETIVAEGLGKYERGSAPLPRPGGARRHVLVPGQVEDDRSVLTGGCGLTSNLELLRRVRVAEPDAFILYKPHPDVLSGHRVGHVPGDVALALADMLVPNQPISSLLDMVDAVHVNTSLAGFEALLRGKQVTTHGVPFYAGWGLTTDLGPVPHRRTASRSLDELVAATLLLYPRYLDPMSGLPCPAETVVRRLCAGGAPETLLPALRRLQGRLKRYLRVFS